MGIFVFLVVLMAVVIIIWRDYMRKAENEYLETHANYNPDENEWRAPKEEKEDVKL